MRELFLEVFSDSGSEGRRVGRRSIGWFGRFVGRRGVGKIRAVVVRIVFFYRFGFLGRDVLVNSGVYFWIF